MAVNFLDIPRLNPGYREGRAADYDEVEIRPSRGEVAEQAKRCMNCGIPFCHGAGCPLGNNIPDFNAAVRENRLRDAYFILAQTSPFPEFTSRVCPALCEASCTAGLPSEPVAVRQIEYEIIENAFRRGYVEPFKPRVRTGMRVGARRGWPPRTRSPKRATRSSSLKKTSISGACCATAFPTSSSKKASSSEDWTYFRRRA